MCAHEILRSRGDERPAWFHDVDLGDDRLRDRNMAVTFSRLPGVGPTLVAVRARPSASIDANEPATRGIDTGGAWT